MEQNKTDITLILAWITLALSVMALVLRVVDLVLTQRREPIRRSFQNDNVLRRGKYAKRHTQWPL